MAPPEPQLRPVIEVLGRAFERGIESGVGERSASSGRHLSSRSANFLRELCVGWWPSLHDAGRSQPGHTQRPLLPIHGEMARSAGGAESLTTCRPHPPPASGRVLPHHGKNHAAVASPALHCLGRDGQRELHVRTWRTGQTAPNVISRLPAPPHPLHSSFPSWTISRPGELAPAEGALR